MIRLAKSVREGFCCRAGKGTPQILSAHLTILYELEQQKEKPKDLETVRKIIKQEEERQQKQNGRYYEWW